VDVRRYFSFTAASVVTIHHDVRNTMVVQVTVAGMEANNLVS
jgi:hypothetical protein